MIYVYSIFSRVENIIYKTYHFVPSKRNVSHAPETNKCLASLSRVRQIYYNIYYLNSNIFEKNNFFYIKKMFYVNMIFKNIKKLLFISIW